MATLRCDLDIQVTTACQQVGRWNLEFRREAQREKNILELTAHSDIYNEIR